jgi:RecB family endonuclease NucS
MSNRISNSALDLYVRCPKAYQFRYVEQVKGDFTSTPLLFGSAIDQALNYILESIRDKKPWELDEAKRIFCSHMEEWHGQNRLQFFKNEVPDELQDSIDEDNPEFQEQVWDNICKRGIVCLDVYEKEVLPLLDEIISVQNKFEIQNEEGDTFTGVVDFIAKLKDGRTVLLDNKTASAKYPKNKVVTSQQLSLYMDQFPEVKYSGYIVLIKNPAKEKGIDPYTKIAVEK